jgi:hypothetical protein
MTIEHVALAIGAFLIVVFLVWRKLRFIEAQQKKTQNELKELSILYNRLFMTAMIQAGDGHKSPAEVIALVPPSNPVETEQQTSVPKIVR